MLEEVVNVGYFIFIANCCCHLCLRLPLKHAGRNPLSSNYLNLLKTHNVFERLGLTSIFLFILCLCWIFGGYGEVCMVLFVLSSF